MSFKLMGKLDSSLVNGAGIRTVLFFSGCTHGCKGCHNKESACYENGSDHSEKDLLTMIYKNSDANKKRITFSGGDPFYQAKELSKLAHKLKQDGFNIWCYTGYTIEQILDSENTEHIALLKQIDTLVDGRFEESLTANALKYTGSSNQRVINVQQYLVEHNITI